MMFSIPTNQPTSQPANRLANQPTNNCIRTAKVQAEQLPKQWGLDITIETAQGFKDYINYQSKVDPGISISPLSHPRKSFPVPPD
jgi:hypothetical protein